MIGDENILGDYEILGVFGVKKALLEKYKQYRLEILSLIRKGQPIPNILAKRYFTVFQELDWVEALRSNEKRKEMHTEASNKAIKYFEAYPEYHFSGQNSKTRKRIRPLTTGKDNIDYFEPYSLNEMIRHCIHNYFFKGMITGGYPNNDDIILYFYKDISEYTNNHLNSDQKESFTDYKKKVIAAYMTICTGRRLFDISKTKFTNRDLFQTTRNAFRPKKRKA